MPGGERGEGPEEGREEDEEEADAVEAEEVLGTKRGNPRDAFDELIARGGAIKVLPEGEGEGEAGEENAVGPPADYAAGGAGQEEEDDDAEEREG